MAQHFFKYIGLGYRLEILVFKCPLPLFLRFHSNTNDFNHFSSAVVYFLRYVPYFPRL